MSPVVSLRVSEEEKRAWVAASGSPRSLSRWLRELANAATAEDGALSQQGAGDRDGDSTPLGPAAVVPRPRCDVHDEFTPWCLDCQRAAASTQHSTSPE